MRRRRTRSDSDVARELREALAAGKRSGASTPFDFGTFLARKRAEVSHDQ
jgi:antitoxin ParD1/3/4